MAMGRRGQEEGGCKGLGLQWLGQHQVLKMVPPAVAIRVEQYANRCTPIEVKGRKVELKLVAGLKHHIVYGA